MGGSEGGLGLLMPSPLGYRLAGQDPERGPGLAAPLVRSALREETPPRASQGRRTAQTSA